MPMFYHTPNHYHAPPFEFHDLLELKYLIYKPRIITSYKLKRSFKRFNSDSFKGKFFLHLSNLIQNSNITSLDSKCESLYKSLNYSLNECAHIVKIKTGPRRKPWVDLSMQSLIEERNKLFINAKKVQCPILLDNFKQIS